MNIAPIHYHKEESTQSSHLGIPYRQDSTGRCWRYSEVGGTAVDPGKLVVSATIVANHVDLSFSTAPAVGDKELSITLGATAASANDYRDGFAVIQDGTGEGILHPLGEHAAVASAGTGKFTIDQGESIQVAGATAETNVDLVKNLYKDVVISVTDQADNPVGVYNVGVTADYYAMVQTWGPAAVWQDEANAVGDMLTTGTGVAGQVEADDAAGEPLIGQQGPQAGTATEYQLVYLRIEP